MVSLKKGSQMLHLKLFIPLIILLTANAFAQESSSPAQRVPGYRDPLGPRRVGNVDPFRACRTNPGSCRTSPTPGNRHGSDMVIMHMPAPERSIKEAEAGAFLYCAEKGKPNSGRCLESRYRELRWDPVDLYTDRDYHGNSIVIDNVGDPIGGILEGSVLRIPGYTFSVPANQRAVFFQGRAIKNSELDTIEPTISVCAVLLKPSDQDRIIENIEWTLKPIDNTPYTNSLQRGDAAVEYIYAPFGRATGMSFGTNLSGLAGGIFEVQGDSNVEMLYCGKGPFQNPTLTTIAAAFGGDITFEMHTKRRATSLINLARKLVNPNIVRTYVRTVPDGSTDRVFDNNLGPTMTRALQVRTELGLGINQDWEDRWVKWSR
jgi:hypothetical protein